MQDVLIPEKGWRNTSESIKIPADQGMIFNAIGKTATLLGRKEVPDVFKLLFVNKRLFWAWLYFASRLMPYGKLPGREREIIILRMAWLCRCRYEWGQHIEIGLRNGLKDIDIVHISKGADSFENEREQSLVLACDEIFNDQNISESTIQKLKNFYSDKMLIEISMLAGHYQMLAGVINTSGLALDASVEDFLREFNKRIG